MCGIVVLHGDTAEQNISATLTRLTHRGPDDQHYWIKGKLAIGFARLAINDESITGRQPYKSSCMIGAFNGEIYNADLLAKQYDLLRNSDCDTHVIAPLFAQLGEQVLSELDGFYSGVIYQTPILTNSPE